MIHGQKNIKLLDRGVYHPLHLEPRFDMIRPIPLLPHVRAWHITEWP